MPTIRDVARRAGVSTATVSRVLNDSGYYDAATARKVRRAVEELAYRRNIHWSRLKRNASQTICFLLGNRDSMNSMQTKMLMSCGRVLAEAGYDLVFAAFRYPAETPPSRLELPRLLEHEGTVDGVILAGVHYGNLLDALGRRKLPCVTLGNTFIGRREHLAKDSVTYDDIEGAREAVRHLVRLGHRRIAFTGNTSLPWLRRRYDGYRQVLEESGLDEVSVTADWKVGNIEYGQLAAAELLRRAQPPAAIFAGNDEIAGGVWKELVQRRIAIPGQVSLMGFGDRAEFSILEPALSTVAVFQDAIGAELAQMLLAKLRKPGLRVPSRTLPCRVVERGSCGPPEAAGAARQGLWK